MEKLVSFGMFPAEDSGGQMLKTKRRKSKTDYIYTTLF
jgi:hypothetical protein